MESARETKKYTNNQASTNMSQTAGTDPTGMVTPVIHETTYVSTMTNKSTTTDLFQLQSIGNKNS